MEEELNITQQDKILLQEMKENCLKADVYADEKRLLKANAITKFLHLQEEINQIRKNDLILKNQLRDRIEEIDELKKQNEFLMKDSNVLQSLEMYLKQNLDSDKDFWSIMRVNDILDKINELKKEIHNLYNIL